MTVKYGQPNSHDLNSTESRPDIANIVHLNFFYGRALGFHRIQITNQRATSFPVLYKERYL
jgi:hypothetical protein